jgi:hypothetical protein
MSGLGGELNESNLFYERVELVQPALPLRDRLAVFVLDLRTALSSLHNITGGEDMYILIIL